MKHPRGRKGTLPEELEDSAISIIIYMAGSRLRVEATKERTTLYNDAIQRIQSDLPNGLIDIADDEKQESVGGPTVVSKRPDITGGIL